MGALPPADPQNCRLLPPWSTKKTQNQGNKQLSAMDCATELALQTFGSQGKRLFLHHNPSRVLLETDLESHFSDPRNACREMWKQLRQEEHTKEPRSAEHLHQTKPILGNTNAQLFPFSASEESIHWIWGQTAASCRGRDAAQNSTSVLLTLCYLSSPACSSAKSSF